MQLQKRPQRYSEENIKASVRAVQEEMGFSAAGRAFNMPRNTIRSRLNNPPKNVDVHQVFADTQKRAYCIIKFSIFVIKGFLAVRISDF